MYLPPPDSSNFSLIRPRRPGAEAKAIIRRAAEARNLDLEVLVGKPCYEVDLVAQRPVEPHPGRQLIAADRAVVAEIVVAGKTEEAAGEPYRQPGGRETVCSGARGATCASMRT